MTPEKLGPWPTGTKNGTHCGPNVSRIALEDAEEVDVVGVHLGQGDRSGRA